MPSLLGIAIFLVAGCSRIPLNYVPSSIHKTSGSLSISSFKYLPAENGEVKPFQIRNKMLGDINFDKNIEIYFKEAVLLELSYVGIKLDDRNRVLSGEIEDFLIEDLGINADWTLKVNYQIKNLRTGDTVYEATKTTKRQVSKLINVSTALNEMIKLNIEKLLNDPAFLRTIH